MNPKFGITGFAVLAHNNAPPPTTALILTPNSSGALVRGPYLQSVMSNSSIIDWETKHSSRRAVVYVQTEESGSSVSDLVVGTSYAILLNNLAKTQVARLALDQMNQSVVQMNVNVCGAFAPTGS